MNDGVIIKQAMEAREKAYAPYSNFLVGAAVLTKDGRIYTGCNVENAAYGLTICAEACAIAKAVSDGNREIEAIAIVADTQKTPVPCGACRQIIMEFSREIKVIMANLNGLKEEKSISELLPFDFKMLKKCEDYDGK